ncbi:MULTISPECIES: BON domain-containing protein [unclassified Crossiella]|uniref:BON domain-containing protein n=1 Tax=unclassified Crossiella TaxID=2620835 RepID=UPI0020005443|nr:MULTISPECIES: BON domain-containing protein [unclassified Crossiella]MCK2238588.1 BON domain-containing protein [Crossiella sp. S99.2]MCK2251842.1 BON domain-containing protein [Crossiella sp. S99.1]
MNEASTPQYEVSRLRRALVADPRTAEQGVKVTVRGQHVFLVGEVASEQRRRNLAEVIGELAPDLVVHNDTHVAGAGAPAGREELR